MAGPSGKGKLIDPYGKGSIIYKLLIVVLLGALVVSIAYPKMIWDTEAANTDLCRFRMDQLYDAQLQFQRVHNRYTADMDSLLAFVKSDPQYLYYRDSLVVNQIERARNLLDTLRQIQGNVATLIPAAGDSAIRDSVIVLEDLVTGRSRDLRNLMEYIRERMITFPALPVATYDHGLEIVERKDYFLKMEVVRRMVAEIHDLKLAQSASQEALANIDSISHHLEQTVDQFEQVPAAVDSLRNCPTVARPVALALQDSAVFKFVNLSCPIDQQDIARVKGDFMKATVGTLELKNHGKIAKGEKTWEKES